MASSNLLEVESRFVKRRAGTTNKGAHFEHIYCSAVALSLILNDDVQDFELTSNDPDFGSFDDVVFKVKSRTNIQTFALQLKYSNHKRPLNILNLKTGSDFNLLHYLEEYIKLPNKDNCKFILVTNRTSENRIQHGHTFTLEHKGRELHLTVQECQAESLFKDIHENIRCFKFNLTDDRSDVEPYKGFFQNLFLHTNYGSVEAIKENIENVFKSKFKCVDNKSAKEYLEYIENYNRELRTKRVLNSVIVKHRVALCLVSPFIQPLKFSGASPSARSNYFKEAMSHFRTTHLVGGNLDILCNLWSDATLDFSNQQIADIKKESSTYQIIPNNLANVDDIDDKTFTILLWLMGRCPLIVIYNDILFTIIELCQDRQFIILYKKNDNLQPPPQGFINLSDLEPFPIYETITENYICSIQGKPEIQLKTLINQNEKINEIITTKELLEMTKENPMLLGEEREQLPPSYISRTLSKIIINHKILEYVNKTTLLLVTCVRDVEHFRRKLMHIKTLDIETFLKNLGDDSFQPNLEKMICISKSECSETEFKTLCHKLGKDITCHQLKNLNEDMEWEWVRSSGNVQDLKHFQLNPNQCSVDEQLLFEYENDNNVNIICGPPGIGKSTLLKSLKNKSPTTHWTVMIDTKNHSNNLKTKENNLVELREYLFKDVCEENKYNRFEKQLLKIMMEEGRTRYFWDGVDENSKTNVKAIINIVKDMSSKDSSKHWITSRDYLRIDLENKFNVVSRTINQFDETEQKNYINKRFKISEERTEKIYRKIKDRLEQIGSLDILGIPLQIYILTEMLDKAENYDTDVFENIMSITDLYEGFIDTKFKIFWQEKMGMDDEKNYIAYTQLMSTKQAELQYYKEASLILYFSHELVTKWGAAVVIKNEEDLKGFIININEYNRPEFFHNSLGEYFAALYLAQNPRRIDDIEDYYLDDKYHNIHYFVDLISSKKYPTHLAILHKDYEKLEKCLPEELLKRNDSGLNAPELLISWCKKYQCVDVREDGKKFIIDDVFVFEDIEPDEKVHEEMLHLLFEKLQNVDLRKILCNTTFLINNNSISFLPLMVFQTRLDIDFKLQIKHLVTLALIGVSFDYVIILNYFKDSSLILDQWNQGLLHEAIYFNSVKTATEMIQTESYKNQITETQILHLAMSTKHPNGECKNCILAKLLIEKGAPLGAASEWGDDTALHCACQNGHYEIAKLLIEKGISLDAKNQLGDSPLHTACANGYYKIVHLLCEMGAQFASTNKKGLTPLHLASMWGHYEIAQFLIEKGAQLASADKEGKTPLHLASQEGRYEIVRLLIENGAQLAAADKEGMTPLHLASRVGSHEILQLLIEKGAQFVTSNNKGLTPLHLSSMWGHYMVVKLLIEKGAQVAAQDNEGKTPLHLASQEGRYGIAQLLIKNGAQFAASDNEGMTPLHLASRVGSYEIVELLIDIGMQLSVPNNKGLTPLHLASMRGHYKIVNLLIEKGAQFAPRDNDGRTALHLASLAGRYDIAQLLIQIGAKFEVSDNKGMTPLHLASQKGQYEIVQLLMECGAHFEEPDNEGKTPLHLASEEGHYKIAELLIECEAQFEAPDNEGMTPLHLASQRGHYEIVQLLIECGAQFTAPDNKGLTPLHLASVKGHYQIIKLLIEKGAILTALDNEGMTPLHLASMSGHYAIVQLLIKNGAELAARNREGRTPLHLASRLGSYETTQLLIENGAPHAAPDNNGNTPLHLASLEGRYEIVRLLIQKDAQFSTPDNQGRTPLHLASLRGHYDIVKLLIEKGAQFSASDNEGMTPLHLASQEGHNEIVQLLIENGAQFAAPNNEGMTPLHSESTRGHYRTSRIANRRGGSIRSTRYISRE